MIRRWFSHMHILSTLCPLQEHPVRVSKCPQTSMIRCTARVEPGMLLSAQGLDVHVWQLGSALDRQYQVRIHL